MSVQATGPHMSPHKCKETQQVKPCSNVHVTEDSSAGELNLFYWESSRLRKKGVR